MAKATKPATDGSARNGERDGGTDPASLRTVEPGGYTVVARRYRPQRFEDVIGQDHVVRSLRNAIRLNRVTHAYLFSGTRGVGKTSMARIFAKCLNCVNGPTESPCLTCDICQAIAVGQDVDVIEIDGASNNGVEAVRELRQNAGLRPSRARFKIYYIDEVHMLSTGAFNALLKTLEEPPEHVKFFFATTEANKIPITVLSRCQRYDFAPIRPDEMVEALADICRREGVSAESEALRTVARRAGGSMRDAQSLLEQLLSAGAEGLTVERVHQALGLASDERILDLLEALSKRDLGRALLLLDQGVGQGVQPAEMLNGLLDVLRDVMVLSAGAEVPLLATAPRQVPRIQSILTTWPLDSVLAALQILSETRGRLRGSPQGRLLVELALGRIARLEDLHEISRLIAHLQGIEGAGPPLASTPPPASPPPPEKKKTVPVEPTPSPSRSPEPTDAPTVEAVPPITIEQVQAIWPSLLAEVGMKLGACLGQGQPTAISGPNLLFIGFSTGYNWAADTCDAPDSRARVEAALRKLTGHPLTPRFERSSLPEPASAPAVSAGAADRIDDDPFIKKMVELFAARRVHVDVAEPPPRPNG